MKLLNLNFAGNSRAGRRRSLERSLEKGRRQYDADQLLNNADPSPVVLRTGPDTLYLVLVVILVLIGTVMSFSASTAYSQSLYGNSFYFLIQRLKHLAVGAVAAIGMILLLTPQRAKIFSVALYCGSILLLIAVLFVGRTGGGAQRWISLGGFSLQPSELAKTGIIMMIAWYMSRNEDRVMMKEWKWKSFFRSSFYGFLIPGMMLGLVCLLVGLEKHFSGIIIIGAIGAVMMFISGTNIFSFLAVIPVAGLLAAIIMNTNYAKTRIESWLNRGADALGTDWQSTQGLYAIGTGGLFGLGLGQSRLKYGYVSQPQNDFVFTVVCEELGFFGALVILLLLLALVGRGFVLAMHAADRFCSLVISGISFKFAIHVILNVGVVTGILPNTGISMPFFSSGGSAIVVLMLDVGIILALSRYCTQKK